MHNRRARPTLRLLASLAEGWQGPTPRRVLDKASHDDLHPLSELAHPIVAKAAAWFGDSPDERSYSEKIRSVRSVVMWEVKAGQWRGGVWVDPATGVHWLCAAGLAKGDHGDRDDFYETLERMGEAVSDLLPTDEDRRLLKRETDAARLTDWELDVQAQVLARLRQPAGATAGRMSFKHPFHNERFADVTVTFGSYDDEGGQYEDCVVEIDLSDKARGTALGWHFTIRVLVSLNPPVQDWDTTGSVYSTMNEPGTFARLADDLGVRVGRRELRAPEPGTVSHYVHGSHLALSYVDGLAVRALCGTFCVPTQDHERFGACPACRDVHSLLPRSKPGGEP